ncbi:hypothetical protein HK101_006413, partial [Irineochytrium annulatum]
MERKGRRKRIRRVVNDDDEEEEVRSRRTRSTGSKRKSDEEEENDRDKELGRRPKRVKRKEKADDLRTARRRSTRKIVSDRPSEELSSEEDKDRRRPTRRSGRTKVSDDKSEDVDELSDTPPSRRRGSNAGKGKENLVPHHDVCDKCGMKSDSKREGRRKASKDKEDLIGSLGELQQCVTCSASYHPICVKAIAKPHRLRLQNLHAASPYHLSGFQCSTCADTVLPHCVICDKAPEIDPVVTVSVPDSKPPAPPAPSEPPAVTDSTAPAPAPPPSTTPVMVVRTKVDASTCNPLLRCLRCSQPYHVPCLIAEFDADEPCDREPDGKHQRAVPGTAAHYQKAFRCNDCLRWSDAPENVLTWRDLSTDDEGGNARSVLFNGRRREYFVKFQKLSYRACEWVSEAWLSGVRGGMAMIRRFEKRWGERDR